MFHPCIDYKSRDWLPLYNKENICKKPIYKCVYTIFIKKSINLRYMCAYKTMIYLRLIAIIFQDVLFIGLMFCFPLGSFYSTFFFPLSCLAFCLPLSTFFLQCPFQKLNLTNGLILFTFRRSRKHNRLKYKTNT